MDRRIAEERIFKGLMYLSLVIVLGSLFAVFAIVFIKGASALNIAMVTQVPQGGYYLGKEGGILNAIVGSVYLAVGAIVLATAISIPSAWYLQTLGQRSRYAANIRMMLDIAAGIPSIIYGAFIFLIMIMFHARASLLWGIITVGVFITPLLTRAIDEVMKTVPAKIKEASYSLGATRLETIFPGSDAPGAPGNNHGRACCIRPRDR